MKVGDLVKYKPTVFHSMPGVAINRAIYIVRWVEKKSDWVCVFGIEPPLQMSMMEVISESR